MSPTETFAAQRNASAKAPIPLARQMLFDIIAIYNVGPYKLAMSMDHVDEGERYCQMMIDDGFKYNFRWAIAIAADKREDGINFFNGYMNIQLFLNHLWDKV
jgi:hypothetical protein